MRKVGAYLFGYLGSKRKEFSELTFDDVDYRKEPQIRPRSGWQAIDTTRSSAEI